MHSPGHNSDSLTPRLPPPTPRTWIQLTDPGSDLSPALVIAGNWAGNQRRSSLALSASHRECRFYHSNERLSPRLTLQVHAGEHSTRFTGRDGITQKHVTEPGATTKAHVQESTCRHFTRTCKAALTSTGRSQLIPGDTLLCSEPDRTASGGPPPESALWIPSCRVWPRPASPRSSACVFQRRSLNQRQV